MQASKLNKRLTFQAPYNDVDDAGGVVQYFTDVFTRWAAVMPKSFNEAYQYNQDLEDVSGEIYVRYDADTKKINSSYRAKLGSQTLEILGAANVDYQNEFIALTYREAR